MPPFEPSQSTHSNGNCYQCMSHLKNKTERQTKVLSNMDNIVSSLHSYFILYIKWPR